MNQQWQAKIMGKIERKISNNSEWKSTLFGGKQQKNWKATCKIRGVSSDVCALHIKNV
jgi:hypothetical protein